MLKYIQRNIRFAGISILLLVIMGAAHTQTVSAELQRINSSYSSQYLQEAATLYTAGNYEAALAYTEKGLTFDSSFADFFYIKAQCLLHLGKTRAQCLEAAEQANTSGLQLRIFSQDELTLLLARFYTETKRYGEVIPLLKSLSFPSADSDLYRAAALYGLGQDEQARAVIEDALIRWSFDARFPLLFFLQERDKPMTRSGKKLADTLLRQLSAWTEQYPALAVYASPFDPNPKENNRRLKIYRNMYAADAQAPDARTQLAAVLAELRYGVIDENTAVEEFFSITAAVQIPQKNDAPLPVMYSDQLIELCKLTGMASVRKTIGNQLKNFTGVMLEDENRDGISDAAVFFDQGRPSSAYFDSNQDEEYEYQVTCSFGTPASIFTPKNGYTVLYDNYPAVQSILQKGKELHYTMRPLAFRWEPIAQTELDLRLQDTDEEAPVFFTLQLRNTTRLIQEHDFLISVLYADEPDPADPAASLRIQYENGQPLAAEITKDSKIRSLLQYKNGIPAQQQFDYDGDGFFEVLTQYDRYGNIEKISVDTNKNKAFEYYELYNTDGTVIKNWDDNEDGSPDIQYTEFASGKAQTLWKHRYSGKPVRLFYENGMPKRLTIGSKEISLVKEPDYDLYWFEQRPSFSDKVAEKIMELFAEKDNAVEACTVMIGNYELYAVYSGGAAFVQLFTAPASIEGRR